ncbi:unnamed protein product [Leptidea sinapis]|uniref:Uncharacterized protein n=1 Tax=Leptidea sinapis TaxID=189913 RepID=A0A5E4QVV7_9NEOP|nr:unnamed protein product [Leptidea sinapis]
MEFEQLKYYVVDFLNFKGGGGGGGGGAIARDSLIYIAICGIVSPLVIDIFLYLSTRTSDKSSEIRRIGDSDETGAAGEDTLNSSNVFSKTPECYYIHYIIKKI